MTSDLLFRRRKQCVFVCLGATWLVGCKQEPVPTPATKPQAAKLPAFAPRQPQPTTRLTLVEIPWPDLGRFDPAVREQLDAAQATFRSETSRPGIGPAARSSAYGELGRRFHAYDCVDAAEACYLNAQTLSPGTFDWPYYLGHLYRAKGNMPKAVEHLQRAVRVKADLAAVLSLAEVKLEADPAHAGDAESLYRLVLDKLPKDDPNTAAALFGLGRIALQKKDFATAVKHLEAALALFPQATAINYPLGMAYRGLGDATKAEAYLAKRGNAHPGIGDRLIASLNELKRGRRLHQNAGVQHYKLGEYKKAEAKFRLAIAEDPNNPEVRANLGSALWLQGDLNGAIEQYKEALRISPDYPQALFNLGVLSARQGKDADAIAYYQAAIKQNPEYDDAHFNLGNSLVRLKRYDEALRHYDRTIQIAPNNSVAHTVRAAVLLRLERYHEALSSLADAHQAMPQDVAVAHLLARLLVTCPVDELRDANRGLELAHRVFKANPALDHLETVAMAYAELGRFDEAVLTQQKALDAARQHKRADLENRITENLARYQAREPCRAPWRGQEYLPQPVPTTAR